ncbi:hypothetical protein CSKR_107546 [Clonorchis sinensis]|uniref:Uncharacterized protein n=1 Tax=Clonorchis sinensis TaxID=79923 RepID=A0A419PRA2_CLOSI|nr:hypothetical protein CSKR_107546 [Clonorchis sinensis]
MRYEIPTLQKYFGACVRLHIDSIFIGNLTETFVYCGLQLNMLHKDHLMYPMVRYSRYSIVGITPKFAENPSTAHDRFRPS